jgi:hypothetical protein
VNNLPSEQSKLASVLEPLLRVIDVESKDNADSAAQRIRRFQLLPYNAQEQDSMAEGKSRSERIHLPGRLEMAQQVTLV